MHGLRGPAGLSRTSSSPARPAGRWSPATRASRSSPRRRMGWRPRPNWSAAPRPAHPGGRPTGAFWKRRWQASRPRRSSWTWAPGAAISPPLLNGRRSLALEIYPYPEVDVVCDLTQVNPFRPGSFDAALLMNVLEHVYDTHNLLASLCQLLKPGGVLLVAVPFMVKMHQVPVDFVRYTHFALERLGAEHGLSVERLEGYYDPVFFLGEGLGNLKNAVLPALPASRRYPARLLLGGIQALASLLGAASPVQAGARQPRPRPGVWRRRVITSFIERFERFIDCQKPYSSPPTTAWRSSTSCRATSSRTCWRPGCGWWCSPKITPARQSRAASAALADRRRPAPGSGPGLHPPRLSLRAMVAGLLAPRRFRPGVNLAVVDSYIQQVKSEAGGRRRQLFPLMEGIAHVMRRSRPARRALVRYQSRFTPDFYADLFEKYRPAWSSPARPASARTASCCATPPPGASPPPPPSSAGTAPAATACPAPRWIG